MEVGVREFKAKLSSHLARAAAGEIATVTDRGQPLRPVRRFPTTGTVLSALAKDRSE